MNWKLDLRSKLYDGLLTALVLYLILILSVLLLRPVDQSMGRPGVLIYTLSLLALSVYCLEHSLLGTLLETSRAWFGMTGGLLAWIVISFSNDLGTPSISSVTSLLLLILVALTVTRLWKRHLPVGGRFYSQTLLLAWTGQLILQSQPGLVAWHRSLATVYQILPYVAILGAVMMIGWIFTQTEKRIQRLSAAPWLVFFTVITVYLLR